MGKFRYIDFWGVKYDLFKVILALSATFYSFYYATTPPPYHWHLVDGANLVFHEAGHILSIFFGEFLYIAGGSIYQILIPTVCCLYFYINRQYYSSSLLIFWIGYNFIDVSVYAGDSVRMVLPLLGGDNSGHDWHNLLFRLNLLNYTDQISNTLFFIGILLFILALYFSLKSSNVENGV